MGLVYERFHWVEHEFCQLINPFYQVVETADGTLTNGMRQLNGLYALRLNRRQRWVGRLFQGRNNAMQAQKKPVCRSYAALGIICVVC